VARTATGQVIERPAKLGTTYALRFRAYGQRRYVTLGGSWEGWTRRQAHIELENVLADVRRGIWRPDVPDTIDAPEVIPTFHEFASEWFAAKRLELRPNTVAAYEYELSHHLLPFFADHRLDELTAEEVDRYRNAKVRERDRRARSATSVRPLSNETINKTLTRLAQILEVAVEYGYIERNPAAGRRRKLKVAKPQRTYLDRAAQILALLDAAKELDDEARSDRRIARRPLLATLVLAGLRIGELLALQWRDVDLAAGRLRVAEAKTDAGAGRYVDIVPALREELAVHRAQSAFTRPDDLVFPTSAGRLQSATNVRNRILTKAVIRANEKLARQGLAELPEGLTPHSLRRTYISLLLAKGDEVPYVMQQVGHTDPKMTLGLYAKVMFRKDGERERLQALVDGVEWAQMGTTGRGEYSDPLTPIAPSNEKPRESGASEDGRGWVRTSDLSRVRRALSR
jgi:integrase